MEDQATQDVEATATETDMMGDAYDRAMSGGEERARDEMGRFVSKEQPEEGEEGAEAATDEAVEASEQEAPEGELEAAEEDAQDKTSAEQVAAPNYVPGAVREVWAEIPEAARDAISKSHHEMSVKLSNMGRRDQAIAPVFDQIQRAAQEFPELANMTPDQLAGDVFELAHTRANLMRDPVNTLLQVASQMGALDGLAARFGGQQQGQQQYGQQPDTLQQVKMEQEIARLNQQLQEASNPAKINQAVQSELATYETQREVESFAADKEHWAVVEADIPALIPVVQQIKGEMASNVDILNAAYDMAIDARGLRATATPAPKATPAQPDPKRTKAAIKAKSVNVKSKAGKPAPMSEREAMSAAYDRMMQS